MIFIKNFFTKFFDFIKKTESRLMKSETLVIVLPIILVVVILLFYVPLLFSNESLKVELQQKISQYTNSDFSIKGPVKITLLPRPSVIIEDAILKDYIIDDTKKYEVYVKKLRIKLSFLSTLIANFSVSSIEASGGIVVSYNKDSKIEKRTDAIDELIDKAVKNNNKSSGKINATLFSLGNADLKKIDIINFPKLFIDNIDFVYYSKIGNAGKINNVSGQIKFSKNKIIGSGKFTKEGFVNNFKIDIKPESKMQDSSIDIFSDFFKLKIIGGFYNSKIPNQKFGKYFSGKVDMEVYSIKDFYKSYVVNKGFIYNHLNDSTKPVSVRSSVIKNNSEIALDNIIINSSIINGRGFVNIDQSSDIDIIDARLFLEKIDLDNIWNNELVAKNQITIDNKNNQLSENKNIETKQNNDEIDPSKDIDTKSDINESELSLNLTKDLRDVDFTLETKISRVKYLGDEIKNVDGYITISKQAQILVMPIQFEVPGKGFIRVSGVIDNRGDVKFIGKIDGNGESLADFIRWMKLESQNLKYDNLRNYSFYTDILMIPNITSLNNLYFNINNQESEILGDIKIDYDNNSTNIISVLNIREFKVDNYFLTSGQNSYLSKGNLIKKLLWLNDVSSKNDLVVKFDKLSYKNLVFKDNFLSAKFGKGYLRIDNANFKDENFDINLKLDIDISLSDPKLDLSASSQSFYYKTPQNTILLDDKNFVENPKKFSINFIDQIFALPSLESFNGNISLDFKNCNFDGFNIRNVKVDSKLRSGVIEFSNLSASIYGGEFSYAGSASVKFDKALSGNFTLNKVESGPLIKDLFGITKINGLSNISASISSYGENKNDFIKNINSDIRFQSSKVNVRGYGLNDLAKKMFNPNLYLEDLKNIEKILFNDNSETSFKQASGRFLVSRGKENRLKIDLSSSIANAIINSKFELADLSFEGLANVLFITGNRQRQIPINIATSFKIRQDESRQNSNLDQVNQYISLIKKGASVNKIFDQMQAEKEKLAKEKIDKDSQEKSDKNNKKVQNKDKPVNASNDSVTIDDYQKNNSSLSAEKEKNSIPEINYSKEQIDMIMQAYPNGIDINDENIPAQVKLIIQQQKKQDESESKK